MKREYVSLVILVIEFIVQDSFVASGFSGDKNGYDTVDNEWDQSRHWL